MDDKAFVDKLTTTLREALLSVKPEATLTPKRMFGGAGFYADGLMFAAWFRSDSLALKLAEADREALLQMGGTQQPMPPYIDVPPAWLEDSDTLAQWVRKSLDYVATLPPKKAKKKKA